MRNQKPQANNRFNKRRGSSTSPTAAQQGAAPDRLQPALPSLVPRFGRSGLRRRVSLVVLPSRQPNGNCGVKTAKESTPELRRTFHFRFVGLFRCVLCSFWLSCLAFSLDVCVFVLQRGALRVWAGVLGSGVMRFAFLGSKYFGCAVRFAFVCGVSALVKATVRGSSRCNRNEPTTAEQGAAPDRLQLRSSFLLSALPAAGELVVVPPRLLCRKRAGSTPVADKFRVKCEYSRRCFWC